MFRILRSVISAWRTVSWSALAAIVPLPIFGFVAWLAGSMAWVPVLEFSFEALSYGLMTAWVAGLPLLVILRRFGRPRTWLYVAAGVGLALAAHALLGYAGWEIASGSAQAPLDPDTLPDPFHDDPGEPDSAGPSARAWAGIYGGVAGWWCCRRERQITHK